MISYSRRHPGIGRICLTLIWLVVFATAAAPAEEWYQGGTLHKSTGREWHAATYRNRLATSADFVARAKAASTRRELLVRAVGLERCI
jgi:hypothetical protein